MMKKTGIGVFCIVVILQGFYIYYLKQKFPLAARAHGHAKVIKVLEEMKETIKEKGDNQAIRQIIIRQTIEEIRLKKLIYEKGLEVPDYAKEILKKSARPDKNA